MATSCYKNKARVVCHIIIQATIRENKTTPFHTGSVLRLGQSLVPTQCTSFIDSRNNPWKTGIKHFSDGQWGCPQRSRTVSEHYLPDPGIFMLSQVLVGLTGLYNSCSAQLPSFQLIIFCLEAVWNTIIIRTHSHHRKETQVWIRVYTRVKFYFININSAHQPKLL